MINAEILSENFKDLIGWRQLPTDKVKIDPILTESISGEYYQQKHPGLKLTYINAILEDDREISEYLGTKVRDASVEMINDILTRRQVSQYGRTLLEESQLFNKFGWLGDKIFNESRFVGFQIRLFTGTGLKAIINKIGLQFEGDIDLKLYLFHTSKREPISTFDVKYSGSGLWKWIDTDSELFAFDGEFNGGAFLLGYYQNDLQGATAINNTDFDFDKGVCGGCNPGHASTWKSLNQNFDIYPFYVPEGKFEPGEMVDLDDVIYTGRKTYGINLKLSVLCDLTSFFVKNKMVLKNLLGLRVALNVLNDIKFSCETNYIEENLKSMILHDLDGHKETKSRTLVDLYDRELKAVEFNIEGINSKCLPYRPDYTPHYGTF